MVAFIGIVIALVLCFFANTVAYAKSYGARICENHSQYSCYTVKRGDSWQRLFPDEEKRNVAMRLNRMNIQIYPGMRIAIPNNPNVTLMDIAPFNHQISPPGEKFIYVSFKELAWGAYNEQGTLLNWGPISGGRGYCPDLGTRCNTPEGKFTIYSKQGAGCISTKFPIPDGGAPMPYCMFFNGGYALHGSYRVPGFNDSHGCVRLFIPDAQWLNQEFTPGGKVTVYIDRSG